MDKNFELSDSEDVIFHVCSEKNSDYHTSSYESDCIGLKKRKAAPLSPSSSSSISSTEVSHNDVWVNISKPPNEIKFDIKPQNII